MQNQILVLDKNTKNSQEEIDSSVASNLFATISKVETMLRDLNASIVEAFSQLRNMNPTYDQVLTAKQQELQTLTLRLRALDMDFVVQAEGLNQSPLRLHKDQPYDLKKECRMYFKRLAMLLHPDRPDGGNKELFEEARYYYDNLDLAAIKYLYYSLVGSKSEDNRTVLLNMEKAGFGKLQSLKSQLEALYQSTGYKLHTLLLEGQPLQARFLYEQLMIHNIREVEQKISKLQFLIAARCTVSDTLEIS